MEDLELTPKEEEYLNLILREDYVIAKPGYGAFDSLEKKGLVSKTRHGNNPFVTWRITPLGEIVIRLMEAQ